MRTSISLRNHPSRVSHVGIDNEGVFDLCFPTAILLPTGPVNPVSRGYGYLTGSVGSPFLFFHTY